MNKSTLFALLCSTMVAAKKADATTTKNSVNSSALASANLEAASADYTFILNFIENFDQSMGQYTSYLGENNINLPQQVADYYYHLADVQSSINLTTDFASNFPFSQFATFITVFPWYSSLLSQGSITTFYQPEYFLNSPASPTVTSNSTFSSTSGSNIGSFSNSTSSNSSNRLTSVASSTSSSKSFSSSTSLETSKSKNSGKQVEMAVPMLFVAAGALLL